MDQTTEESKEELKGKSSEAEENSDEVEETVEAKEEAPKEEAPKDEQEDFKEKYYYLAAEMQNMQRRFEKEKESLLKYGSEKILRDILEVVDNFERTIGFIKDDEEEKVKNLYVGLDMVNKLFLSSMEKHGLKKVNALGEIFDPNLHEALAQAPAEGKKDMEIVTVHQDGYTLNERLIRPAKVVVAKN